MGLRALRIFIDNTLHVDVAVAELVGIQSWEDGAPGRAWVIEFTLRSGATVKTEYGRRDIWVKILQGIAETWHA